LRCIFLHDVAIDTERKARKRRLLRISGEAMRFEYTKTSNEIAKELVDNNGGTEMVKAAAKGCATHVSPVQFTRPGSEDKQIIPNRVETECSKTVDLESTDSNQSAEVYEVDNNTIVENTSILQGSRESENPTGCPIGETND
jgi:uncharacterized Zn finger protein